MMTNSDYTKSLKAALYCLALSFFHPLNAFSADCYFMAAQGYDIIRNGFTRAKDITTVHGFDFMHQKWAMCIDSYCTYTLFGQAGILIGTAMLFFVALFIFWLILDRLNPGEDAFNAFLLFVAAISLGFMVSFRPQMISLVCLLVFLVAMEDMIQQPRKMHYAIFFGLSIIVMWYHSTMWVMLLIFMLPYVFDLKILKKIPGCVNDKSASPLQLLLTFISILLGSLFQPNGIHQYKYMYVCLTATSDIYKELINELLPQLDSNANICIYLLILSGVALMIKTKKYRLRGAYMMAGALIFSLTAYRLNFYAVILACFGIAINYQVQDFKLPKKTSRALLILIVSASCLWSLAVIDMTYIHRDRYDYRIEYAGKTAIDTLTKEVRPENTTLFCATTDAGSYAILQGYKVYFDCRAEVYDININHKKDVLTEYNDILNGKYKNNTSLSYMKDFDDDYHFDYYVVHKEGGLIRQSLDAYARKIYQDEYNAIYTFRAAD